MSGGESETENTVRCNWVSQHEDYEAYHDDEWGRPVTGDSALFERICLEGFQAGLSWLTILRKRESFRSAFVSFEPSRVAEFDQKKFASDPYSSIIFKAHLALFIVDKIFALLRTI